MRRVAWKLRNWPNRRLAPSTACTGSGAAGTLPDGAVPGAGPVAPSQADSSRDSRAAGNRRMTGGNRWVRGLTIAEDAPGAATTAATRT